MKFVNFVDFIVMIAKYCELANAFAGSKFSQICSKAKFMSGSLELKYSAIKMSLSVINLLNFCPLFLARMANNQFVF